MGLRGAVRALRSPAFFQPFLIYAGAQLIVLCAVVFFHVPGISPLAEPIVRTFGSSPATHYPEFYILLPAILEKLFALLHVSLGSLLIGTATIMLCNWFEYRPWPLIEALAGARGRYKELFGVILVTDLLILTLSTLIYRMGEQATAGILAAPFAARGLALLVVLALQALMAYVVASVVISGTGVLGAFRRSVKLALANPLMTFLLVTIAFIPHVPIRYLWSKSAFIVSNLKPEVVAWLIGLDVLVGSVTSLFFVAWMTRLYLFTVREA